MKLSIFKNSVSNIFAENRLLKFIIVLLTIGQLISAYAYISLQNQLKIIVVPRFLSDTVSIKGNIYDDKYLILTANDIAYAYWSFLPETVVGSYQNLATYTYPDNTELRTRLYNLANSYKGNDVSSQFIIRNTQVSVQPNKIITVSGHYKKYIYKNLELEKERTLTIMYDVDKQGNFFIVNIKEDN